MKNNLIKELKKEAPKWYLNNLENINKELEKLKENKLANQDDKEPTKSSTNLYQPPTELEGYVASEDGLYCPCIYAQGLYLKIERGMKSFNYILYLHENGRLKPISNTFVSDIPITEENNKLNKKLGEWFKKFCYEESIIPTYYLAVKPDKEIPEKEQKTLEKQGIITNTRFWELRELLQQGKAIPSKNAIINSIDKISKDLKATPDFEQITHNFKIYQEKEKDVKKEDVVISEDNIKYNEDDITFNEEIANEIRNKIQEKGLIPYLNSVLDKIHLGDHKNIIRKVLGGFNVISAGGSYFFETVATSEAGKTYEDEIAFLKMTPQEFVIKINDPTYSSFTRICQNDPKYLNRKITYMGDWGAKGKFEEVEKVMNVGKTLVTEGEYGRTVTENGVVIDLNIKVESTGFVYQTITAQFTEGDDQLESRTIKSTPPDVDDSEILDFIDLTRWNEYSIEYQEAQEAQQELQKFQEYLKSLIFYPKRKILTSVYSHVFKRYALQSPKVKREYQQLRESFRAYCILTNHACNKSIINPEVLIPSQKHIQEFFNKIVLENPLMPVESEFLKMLLNKSKDKKTNIELIILDDEDKPTEKGFTLTRCYNIILEENFQEDEEDNILSFDDLDYKDYKKAIKRLLTKFGLNKDMKTLDHHNIFFTVSRINRTYKTHRAFKNVDDIPTMLQTLTKRGYLGKLDYYDERGGKNQNIYYLTPKVKEIKNSLEITSEDLKQAKKYEKEHLNIKDKKVK